MPRRYVRQEPDFLCKNLANDIVCPIEQNRIRGCFVSWTKNTDSGNVTVLHRGCWYPQISPEGALMTCQQQAECVTREFKKEQKHLNNPNQPVFFCCCTEPKCNDAYRYESPDPSPFTKTKNEVTVRPQSDDLARNVLFSLLPVFLLAILIAGCFVLFRQYRKRRAKRYAASGNGEHSALGGSLKMPATPVSLVGPIDLTESISSGRYGRVWKANANGKVVAVKISADRDSWTQETDIYVTPRMNEHPNIVTFLGSDIRANGNLCEYWLVTNYCEHGSLYDYLKAHTVTIPELLHISSTMLSGLTFLHEEYIGDEKSFKPTIIHRDFKSSNVLLKPDLTACIADFGLAVKCLHGRPETDRHDQVGTRRYMAPEVLEGATEFSAFAFRQIDVYAAAIVLWELMSRCAFSKDEVIEKYRVPFEEIGLKPSLQDLQEHICKQRGRPAIKSHWRNHDFGNMFCTTIEEMWDMEPEARVPAGCAFERISKMYSQLSTVLVQNEPEKTPLISKKENTAAIIA